jgi:hypothetical protein
MPKYYQLPNGAYYEAPDELSPGEAYKKAFRDYPEAFGGPAQKGPESGFLPAAKAGISSLTSDITALAGRTGLMDEAAAEKKIQAEEEYRKRIFKPTQTWGEAPLTKGLELLGGSLPYMAAPLAAGVAGAATPIAGAGAAAAGLASLGQFTGSNLSRQMDEGARLGQTELGSAFGAAVPQAALDLLSFKLAPGIRQIFAAAGKEVPEQVAEQIAKQGTMRTLRDYGIATGRAMGAEGITEAGQQFFERLQAGLNLTDAKARDEYWDSLVGGAVLGGALAPAGRYIERGQIAQRQAQEQRDLEAKKAAEEAKLAAAEAEQLKAYRQTPEYLADIQQRYADLVKQEQDLIAKTKVKPEGTDPASMKIAEEEKKAARKELADFRSSDDYQKTLAEFIEAKPLLKQIEQKRKATEDLFGQQDLYTPEDTSPAAQALSLQAQIADLKKQQAKKGLTLAEQQPFQNRINALEEQLEKVQPYVPTMGEYKEVGLQLDAMIETAGKGLTAATTTADLQRHTDNLQRLQKAKADLEKLRPLIKTPPEQLTELRKQVDKAQEAGDLQALQRLTPMLAEAEKSPELPFPTQYEIDIEDRLQAAYAQREALLAQARNTPSVIQRDSIAARIAEVDAEIAELSKNLPSTAARPGDDIAAEIAQGRENAARVNNEVVKAETEALARIGNKPLSNFALGRRSQTLREAREALRGATKPTERTVSKGIKYYVVDGKLSAGREVKKLVRRNEQDWSAYGKETAEDIPRKVQEREALRKELQQKLAELEADYAQFVQPSPALQFLHQTYTDAIKKTLADVELKLKRQTEAERLGQRLVTVYDENEKRYKVVPYSPKYPAGAPRVFKTQDPRYPEAKPKGELVDVASEALTASDERVADLIDRLLGPATDRTAEEKAQRPLEDLAPSLFDVDAQKKIAEAARRTALPGSTIQARMYDEEGNLVYKAERGTRKEPQARGELPIEQAQNALDEIKSLQAQLDETNQKIKAEGSSPDIDKLREDLAEAKTDAAKQRLLTRIDNGLAKIARLQDLRELRDSTERLLENATERYYGVDLGKGKGIVGGIVGQLKQRENQLAAQQAPETPSTADLFGGLEEARSEKNQIQAQLDRLYNERDTLRADLQRRGQVGATPQLQALVDQYSKDTPRLRQVEDEIAKQEAELQRVSGKTSARFTEFALAREAERTAEAPSGLAQAEQELKKLRDALPYVEQVGDSKTVQQIKDAIRRAEQRIEYEQYRLETGKGTAPKEKTATLPGFERRAGVRPVDEQQLRDARTELVALQNTGEELRKVQASQDKNPTRYLRQLAIQKNEQYEAFLTQSDDPITKTWPAQKLTILKRRYPKTIQPTQRDVEYYDALRKQVKYFENIMRGGTRRDVDQAVQDNLDKQDQARARVAELESRQRAYEQQEAVRTGAAPGEAEAQRLIEGEGYRTDTGATRKAPKKLASWGITTITKKNATPVAPAKVAMTSNVLRQYQKQVETAATTGAFAKDTLNMQLRRATANIEKLNNALQQVYPASVAASTDKEITDLLAAGLSPEVRAEMRDMAQVYANLKNSVAGNTVEDVLARIQAEIDRLAKEPGRFATRRGEADKNMEERKTLSLAELISNLRHQYRIIQSQAKTADPWTASFNALIQETNANALLASQEMELPAQEARFAQLEVESERRKLNSFSADTRKRIADAKKMPDSAEKTALLDELNDVSERQMAGLPVEPRAVADVTALGMPEMRRRYEVGAYNAQLAAYKKAVDESNTYQERYERAQQEYQKARVEQLSLLKAYGSDLQASINAEVEQVQKLTPEIEKQAKANAETKAQLDKANQALAKAKIEERKKAAEVVPPQTAAFEYTAKEREALRRIREGLGLPGVRYETDTTSTLVTKTKAAIRQTLTLEQAKLDKLQAPIETAKQRLAKVKDEQAAAKRDGDWKEADRQQVRIDSMQDALEKLQAENAAAVREQTLKVQELQNAFESVRDLGERVVTPVGEGAEERVVEREESGVLPGTRLPRRRVGPVARVGTQPPGQMLSGTAESREAISKGNRPMQTGTQRLTAADMNQQNATSVSLAVLQQQRDAATGDRKTQLDAAFKAATNGMTEAQINDKIDEGNKLIAEPGAAEVVAARERMRAADAALKTAQEEYKAATTPAAKEIAKDTLDLAEEAAERATQAYRNAQALVATGMTPNIPLKTKSERAIEEGLRLEESGGGQYGEDLAPTMYTSTATRTESNPAVREAILDGRLLDALDRLAVEGSSDLIKQNAKELRSLVLRTKVIIDPDLTVDGKPVPAAYSPSLNAVIFRPTEITDEDIIHEVTHAATMRVMSMPDSDLTDRQRNAKKELEAIFKQVSKNKALVEEHGLKNLKEFVSEVQSNAEFRAAINKQPWYKRLWHALTRLWSTAPIETIADRASRLTREIYLPSQKIEEKTVPSIFRREAPVQSSLVATDQPGKIDTLRGNLFGLAGRVQYIDALAAADKGIVAAEGAGKLSSTEAFNAQYFMRMGDKVTQAAGQFITSGPVRIVADKRSTGVEYRYESTDGPSLLSMSEHLERGAKAANMSPQEAEVMLTTLIAGQRANSLVNGWERLQSDNPAAAKAEYANAQARMRANPKLAEAMEAAMKEYKAYNEGLLNFAAQCGYLSKDEVARLNKLPYVSFYRVEDGKVQLNVLGERPITIGNLKDSPDLQQFLGDNKKIMPILTSAVQNTFMLTRAAMRNKSTMETSNALFKAGFVSKMGKGPGLANPSTVHYKIDGADHFATIDADTFGIPAELIVRGMEGIKTLVPDVVKMLGIPASILRKFITRSPAYVVRQLVREPVNAFIVSGVDGVPVFNALRQLANMRAGRSPEELALMRGLVVSSNIYTGDEADMQKFLNDVAAGRSGWDKFLGKLDTMALQADSATRATIYQDGLKKGLSEAQAQFRAMESQNFGRRGLSPSMQIMNTLVPFFNAQIQGLDVLYRSFRGRMPYAEQLEIQRKIAARGALLFVGSMAYALMMQDDEDYKKAKPEERYANFFVHIPGVKDPLKLPVPFEVGLFFMGLPQALVDMAVGDTKAKEAIKAMGKLLLNSAPSVIPAAPKPILEAFYGQTQFGPIESEREKKLEAGERFRPQTTELAKTLGGFTGAVGVSPLMLEHFVRGYTGGLGIALMSTLNPLLRSSEEGAKVPLGAAKQPFIGGLFQTSEGRFYIDRAYERMDEIVQAQQTYKDYIKRGMPDRAAAYAREKSDLLMGEAMAGKFRQKMGELFAQERAIAANPRLSEAEKERQIEQLKLLENNYAKQFYAITDRTIPR